MSSDDNTPQRDTPGATRPITVEVPAHRVEQFGRFHERFLRMAAQWDAQIGNEDVRGPRRGPRRGRRGRCHGRRADAERTA